MTFFTRSFAAVLIVLISMCASASPARAASSATTKASSTSDADRVVHDLCGKSVAMLGESPMHGFGKTLEFKAALVPRLIQECHYNAFFIESGIYDFLNIQKRLKSGRDVTEPMIAAAIGGLWATREVQPLIPFLLEKAKTGSVTLGGLDDQLSRGTYAQHEMPLDLVEYLQGEEKTRCLAILQRHTLWQYAENAPYGPKDKALILGCLASIETALTKASSSTAPFREYDAAMIDSLKRFFARDFRKVPSGVAANVLDVNERDRSMYLNFQWLLSGLPPHSKVIVWTANVHAAKTLNGVSGEEGVVPFGSYVKREFKGRAFALGFSALSGSYARTGQPARQLSVAPGGSLEAQAFAGRESDTAYLSLKELRKLGPVPARLRSGFSTARWGEVLDGMVIFREESAPDFIRH